MKIYSRRKCHEVRRHRRHYWYQCFHPDLGFLWNQNKKQAEGMTLVRMHFNQRRPNHGCYCFAGWDSERNRFMVGRGTDPVKMIRYGWRAEMHLKTPHSKMNNLKRKKRL